MQAERLEVPILIGFRLGARKIIQYVMISGTRDIIMTILRIQEEVQTEDCPGLAALVLLALEIAICFFVAFLQRLVYPY